MTCHAVHNLAVLVFGSPVRRRCSAFPFESNLSLRSPCRHSPFSPSQSLLSSFGELWAFGCLCSVVLRANLRVEESEASRRFLSAPQAGDVHPLAPASVALAPNRA